MIGIVGGGITGLVLSHCLAGAGVEHVLLESAGRPGGVIHSIRLDGHLLECGPQRTRLTAGIARLIAEFRLQEEVILAPARLPLFVYREGRLRLVPLSLRDAVATDLLPWRAKARLLLEPFTPGEREDETVAGYISRKLGAEAYEYLIGPMYGGLYASDPRDMLMRHSLSRALRELGVEGSLMLALLRRVMRREPIPAACSFREGMATLTDAIFRRQRDSIRLNSPVTAIRRVGDGYELAAAGESVTVSHVVLTTPADAAAELLDTLAPEKANRLRALNYNPLAVVHLHTEHPLRGMGYQVPLREELLTRGVTWNDSMFGRRGIYTAYLGGSRNPDAVNLPDEFLRRAARDEFRLVTGADAEALYVSRISVPAWDRSWSALDDMRLPAGVHICSNYESRAGLPGRIAAARSLAGRLVTASSPGNGY